MTITVALNTTVPVALSTTCPLALNMTIPMALSTTGPLALNMTGPLALNTTIPVAWNATGYDVFVNEKGQHLPFLILKYIQEKPPVGNFTWNMPMHTIPLFTAQGWELPITSCYFPKFIEFVMTGDWNSKYLKDIPGIGEVYAARMKRNLREYCSVPQLFDMYLYCLVKGEPQVFYDLLYWAAEAYNNNGNMHIQRAFQAFIQKHLGSLHPWPVKIEDPYPNLPEIEFEWHDMPRSG